MDAHEPVQHIAHIDAEPKLVHYIMDNPILLLILFGMTLVLVSVIGAKSAQIPWLKFKIEFKMRPSLRVAAFVAGLVCVAAGIWFGMV